MNKESARNFLDVSKASSGYGKTSTSLINILHGMNHRGAGNIVSANTDEPGFTFFTKPNLNLSYDNVNNARRLSFLSIGDDRTMASAIRCMLSPKVENPKTLDDLWALSSTVDRSSGRNALPRSSLVNDRYAFLPLLSNTLLNLSGWPDFTIDAFQSKEGLRKEVVSWVDSIGDMYHAFDLTGNFQNIDGDPISTLFSVWMEYAARVAEGSMVPYANCIIENEIDYQTRIYRFIMDPTRTYIRKIADVGVAFPSALSNGAPFNYNSDQLRVEDTKEISVRFSCTGVRYNDPITIYNFNTVVGIFNATMRDSTREAMMVKLSNDERRMFNYRGYPRISDTNELEWWVTKDEYAAVTSVFKNYTTPDFI
jgi:hypothetical protein